MLIISTVPSQQCAPEDVADEGKNRFECRTCPYQMVLDRRYFERKDMSLKAAEDVLGGKDSWKNVDKTEGALSFFLNSLPSSDHSPLVFRNIAYLLQTGFTLNLRYPSPSLHEERNLIHNRPNSIPPRN